MNGPLDTPLGATMSVGEAKRRCAESCPAGSGPNYWALAYVCTLPRGERGPALGLRGAAAKYTAIGATRLLVDGVEYEAVVLDRIQGRSWARLWTIPPDNECVNEWGGPDGERWVGELIVAYCSASQLVL